MKEVDVFFRKNPIFTFDEFKTHFGQQNTYNTIVNRLRGFVATGRLKRVKRGVYIVIPKGVEPEKYHPDSYALAAKIGNENSIIGFHSAFEMLGVAHQIFNTVYYLSAKKRSGTFVFGSLEIKCVQAPIALIRQGAFDWGTKKQSRMGIEVMHTDWERTIVDSIRYPEYAGGLEELARCLIAVKHVDMQRLFEYLSILEEHLIYPRVGFWLETLNLIKDTELKWLEKIREKIPQTPTYLVKSRPAGGVYMHDWNLIVPQRIIELVSELT